jgi:hypothetical protein
MRRRHAKRAKEKVGERRESKTPRKKTPDAKTAASPQAAEPTEEERRRELARKLEMFERDWWRCPRRLCRRKRACGMPEMTCFAPRPPQPPMTPDQEAALRADLMRALERRRALLSQ